MTSSTVTETTDDEVPEKIVWGKPMFSKRVLEVRKAAERAWKLRQAARTVNWEAITKGRGYQLVRKACKEV